MWRGKIEERYDERQRRGNLNYELLKTFDTHLTQFEDDLFAHFDWVYRELQDGDEY